MHSLFCTAAMNYITITLISASPATVLQSIFRMLIQGYIHSFLVTV